MKRFLILIFSFIFLTVMFSGCDKETVSQTSSAIISEPDYEQSNDAFVQEDMDEIMPKTISINELIKKYGSPETITGAVNSENGVRYVHISFKSASFVLHEEDNKLSFDNSQINNSIIVPESDYDKALHTESMIFTDPSMVGPRSIKIGDSYKKVRSSFLDMSEKYINTNNQNRIYGIEDYVENQDNGHFVGVGGFESNGEGGASKYLSYVFLCGDEYDFRVWNDYGMLKIKFVDDKVTEIYLGYYNDEI